MPFDYDDVIAAFFRGEFAYVISQFEGLHSVAPNEDLPYAVFMFGGLARYFSGDFEGAILGFPHY